MSFDGTLYSGSASVVVDAADASDVSVELTIVVELVDAEVEGVVVLVVVTVVGGLNVCSVDDVGVVVVVSWPSGETVATAVCGTAIVGVGRMV